MEAVNSGNTGVLHLKWIEVTESFFFFSWLLKKERKGKTPKTKTKKDHKTFLKISLTTVLFYTLLFFSFTLSRHPY